MTKILIKNRENIFCFLIMQRTIHNLWTASLLISRFCSSQICTTSRHQKLDPCIIRNFNVNYHKSLVKFVPCYRHDKRFNHFSGERSTHRKRSHSQQEIDALENEVSTKVLSQSFSRGAF